MIKKLKRKYIVMQLGARMHYAVPTILNKNSSLVFFYTDIHSNHFILDTEEDVNSQFYFIRAKNSEFNSDSNPKRSNAFISCLTFLLIVGLFFALKLSVSPISDLCKKKDFFRCRVVLFLSMRIVLNYSIQL